MSEPQPESNDRLKQLPKVFAHFARETGQPLTNEQKDAISKLESGQSYVVGESTVTADDKGFKIE